MQKKVMLTILGEQTDSDGTVNEIEMMTEGSLEQHGGMIRISYLESEIVGTEGAMMTIELQDGAVRLFRDGDYSSNFMFRQGQRCLNLYSTPFGTIELGAYPSEVRYGVREKDGEVHLRYDLDIQGRFIGNNHLRMAWKLPIS